MEAPAQQPPQPPSQQPSQQPPYQQLQQESVESPPRSRKKESWDDPALPIQNVSKLRFMCSYGGHIVPRPHDKSLCYVGGDTRMVVVDRNTTLSDLSSRLSNTLIDGRSFTLKYQLPNEDLDSLISVTTDEDLDNMIDEYDRVSSNNSAVKLFRIRLFLFPTKPESASSSIGPILESVNSEDWFLGALNGVNGVLNRGFSDSQSVDCLLGLDNDAGIGGAAAITGVVGGGGISGNDGSLGSREMDNVSSSQIDFKTVKQSGGQDVHSVPDSPMLDTASSFGSSSSSPSLANLPPIRVHVEDTSGGVRVSDQKLGIEEQFAQINVTTTAIAQKQDDGFVGLASPPPPMPTTVITGTSTIPMSFAGGGGGAEYGNRVVSDDERSDQGVPVGQRRVPTQSQPQALIQTLTLPMQSQQKLTGVAELASPDSVSSDSSLTSATYRQKPMFYQESGRVSANHIDPKMNISDPNTRIQIQQVQESGYMIQPQSEQQQQQQHQFVHAGAHYIHHQPISSYYPVYPSQQHHHHQQLDQQYPVYYIPANQAQQSYNLAAMQQQPSYGEQIQVTNYPSRPQTPPPNPAMINTVPPSYNPNRNAPQPRTTPSSPMIQVAAPIPNQHQQQFVGYSQIHHPAQSLAPNSAPAANYTFEYADPSHAQIYYTQPYAPSMPAQYQTMTSTTSTAGLSEASSQPGSDQMKQQIRNLQAL